jgi:predicted N-acetyltransferase YhbS
MTESSFSYRLERPGDSFRIETLHAEVFGPGRFAKSAYRLREGVPHDPMLSFVAERDGVMVASVRQTPILIGGRPALLLGPLVVEQAFKGQGAGKTLVRTALEAAKQAGHALVLLVGDEPYYGPLGFSKLPPYAVIMPGPADPRRVLVAGLKDGALDGLSGRVTSVRGRAG